MNLISLTLWGRPFIECLTLESDFKINQVMKDDACFSYVHSGTQEIFSPYGKIVAKGGESILTKCNNFIAKTIGASPVSEFRSVVFHINLTTVKKAFEGKDTSFLTTNNASKNIDSSLKIGHNLLMDNYIQSLSPYFDNPDLVKEEIMVLKLQELVYLLCDSDQDVLATHIIGTLQSKNQISFEDIISANLYSGLTISELAHLTARSESTFKRDFKKWYNENPAKYLKVKRLEKAAELLKSSNLQVNEIAWNCGFENAAHFGAAFRLFHGQTPKQFRS